MRFPNRNRILDLYAIMSHDYLPDKHKRQASAVSSPLEADRSTFNLYLYFVSSMTFSPASSLKWDST